jgi:fermentation-respiration switch protein FrsA (DUF1100 family)
MTSIALTILVMLAVSYAIFALTLYFMQSKFVYSPIRQIPYTPAELGLDFEDVYFRTSDKLLLHGWFVPAPNSTFTVLYCHGNGGNIMFYLDTVNLLNGLGLNCFIFDYRGYGQSQGRPSEAGTYLDTRAAFRWLTKTKKIPREQIIVFGWSLGGSAAAYLASKTRPRGLVLEGAFTSYRDIGACYYPYIPVRLFARFDYPTIDFIRRVRCPVMVIHSREDETIPFEMGLELYDAANEPKEFVELHGGHNDASLTSAETYKNAWQKWLKSLQSAEQTRITNTQRSAGPASATI